MTPSLLASTLRFSLSFTLFFEDGAGIFYLYGAQKEQINADQKQLNAIAFFQSVKEGNSRLVQKLLQDGADVNAKDDDGYTAPIVLAKGQDHMAIHIGKIARESGVPILRLPPLARSIYYSTEVGGEIPRGLFIAVAQVLAYIFQLKRKNRLDEVEAKPDELSDFPIPEELKR